VDNEGGILQAVVDRHSILLGKLIGELGLGNILYGIEDPTQKLQVLVATGTSDLTLSTSAQSIVGDGDDSKVRIILPLPGDWLIEATFDFNVTATDPDALIGELYLDDSGSPESRKAIFWPATALDRATVTQSWKVTTTAINVPVELKAYKNAAGGTALAETNTRITAIGGGGAADIRLSNHGLLEGLSDINDHLYALLKDGSRALEGDLAVDAGITIDGMDVGAHGDAYNGSLLEPMTFVITSNGTTITGTIDKNPSGDLTERFSDGYTTLLSGATVTLIAGSATVPKKNYIYVLQSNKGVLVASDSDWPATEHIKIAEVIVQTAALVQSDGILANRNWNDFAKGADGQGHHLHAWARLRWEHAAYKSGSAVTWSGSGTAALDLAISAGQIYQMHLHIDAAFDTTDPDNVYVVNHPTAYTITPDIETLVLDSGNVSLSNRYYNLVIWRSVSSGSEEEH
jgi:hypothetical protein